MSIWVKTDDDIGVMALDNIQLSARITPLEQKVKSLQSYESKKLVINTTYCSTVSSTYARWSKFGAIVVVEIYDVELKGGKSTDNVAIITSGLPKPAFEYTVTLPTNVHHITTDYVRIRVTNSGVLKPWYMGTSVDGTNINGMFTYISAQ